MDTFCSYNKMDRDTLEPLDIISLTRIEALLSGIPIKGMTFLDIGFNSGLLSLQLAQRGALSITAVDVQKQHIDSLNSLINEKDISSIEVVYDDFMNLSEEKCFNTVYFLEVLHWAIHQKYSIEDVLHKLFSLTEDNLFIEFPWDCTDPSIRTMTNITQKEYDSFKIIQCIHRYFDSISFVYFPDYFPNITTKRALIRCSAKKLISKIVTTNFNFSGYEILKKGTCELPILHIVESDRKYYALKGAHTSSYLAKTDSNNANKYLHAIDSLPDTIFIRPLPFMEGCYLNEYGGMRYYITEYVYSLYQATRLVISVSDIISISVRLALDFSKLDRGVIEHVLNEYDYSWMPKLNASLLDEICKTAGHDILSVESNTLLYRIYTEMISQLDTLLFDSISHSDLNISNILITDNGFMVTDFEGPQPATPYFDGFFALILYGADKKDFEKYIESITDNGFRVLCTDDIIISMIYSIAWINYILSTQQTNELTQDGIFYFEIGYRNFLSFSNYYIQNLDVKEKNRGIPC